MQPHQQDPSNTMCMKLKSWTPAPSQLLFEQHLWNLHNLYQAVHVHITKSVFFLFFKEKEKKEVCFPLNVVSPAEHIYIMLFLMLLQSQTLFCIYSSLMHLRWNRRMCLNSYSYKFWTGTKQKQKTKKQLATKLCLLYWVKLNRAGLWRPTHNYNIQGS